MDELDELEEMDEINKHMIATTAIHKLGDLSRELDIENHLIENLCKVTKETKTDYYGMWSTGMGFFNIRFPKKTTRELTKGEIDYFNTLHFRINNQPSFKLNID